MRLFDDITDPYQRMTIELGSLVDEMMICREEEDDIRFSHIQEIHRIMAEGYRNQLILSS